MSTTLGGVVWLVFLPEKRLVDLFQAEPDLPTEDARLLPKDEAIRPKNTDPHAGLINL